MKKLLLPIIIAFSALLLVACKPEVKEDNNKPEDEIIENDNGLVSINSKVYYNNVYKAHTIKTLKLISFESETPAEEGFFDRIEIRTIEAKNYEVSNLKFTIKATNTLYLRVVVGQDNGQKVSSELFELTNETKEFNIEKILLDPTLETKNKTSVLKISFQYYFDLDETKSLDSKITGAGDYFNSLSNGGFNGVLGKNIEGNGEVYKLELYGLSFDVELA